MEEIMVGLRAAGYDPSDAAARGRQIASELGLDSCLNRKPFDLDLWQRKLLGLAIASAPEPDILIVDEPALAQDRSSTDLVLRHLRRWASEGRSSVVISHNADLCADVADVTAVLNCGRLVAFGETQAVLRRIDEFTSQLVLRPHLQQLGDRLNWATPCASLEAFARGWARFIAGRV
jgi:energy-coupling factor transport system ATP-binding protein